MNATNTNDPSLGFPPPPGLCSLLHAVPLGRAQLGGHSILCQSVVLSASLPNHSLLAEHHHDTEVVKCQEEHGHPQGSFRLIHYMLDGLAPFDCPSDRVAHGDGGVNCDPSFPSVHPSVPAGKAR